MRELIVLVLVWVSPVLAHAEQLTLEDGGSIELDIGDGVSASLARTGDWVFLTGPGTQELRFEVPLFQEALDKQAGYLHDIDGDGFRDLMVRTDIGYGGVNLFHKVLMYRANQGWVEAGEVANPEFTPERNGFVTAARSGPFWYHERWDIGPAGMPYRQAEHTITFGGFELRRVFAPDGSEAERLVVAEGLGLYDAMEPVRAHVGSDGASAQSPDPNAMTIALWLEPGTDVTLMDWDEVSLLVLVETSAGTRVWIDAETIDLP